VHGVGLEVEGDPAQALGLLALAVAAAQQGDCDQQEGDPAHGVEP
jgi:hypothetical protein